VTGASSGVAGVKSDVVFSVSENTDGQVRTGYIHVRAGRLDYAVTVTQREAVSAGVWIMDASGKQDIAELVFPATTGPLEQQFRLKWFPPGASVTVTTTTVAGGATAFVYHSSSDQPATPVLDPWGEKLFNIRPDALTQAYMDEHPFMDRHSEVKFSFDDGGGATGSVRLRQTLYSIVPEAAEIYMLDGGTSSFHVRSNTTWVVSDVVDPDGILDLSYEATLRAQSGDAPDTSPGKSFSFKIVNDASLFKYGRATITLHDPTERAKDAEIVILGANCGVDGVALVKKVGNTNSYKTHRYGTGANERCWMVQNSIEGSTYAVAKYYGTNPSDFNGYYYTDAQKTYACPTTGWHLPSMAEANVLVTAATADRDNSGRWWCGALGIANGAFAGGYNYTNNWVEWEYSGLWRRAEEEYFYGVVTGGMGVPNIISINEYFSVRCVQTNP
jgi:hypothetical protein